MKTLFIADDRTEFETEKECKEYEQELDKVHSSMIIFDKNFDKIDVVNACCLSNACYLYVKGNAEKVGAHLEEQFGFGEGIYKSGMYIVDEEEARWNFIADLILFADVLIRNDLKFYFLLNIIIYSVITKNLSCGGVKIRAIVNPTEKEREQYDNNSSIVNAVATLIGAGVAMIFDFDLRLLFVFALIGNACDNVLYIYIYNRIRSASK